MSRPRSRWPPRAIWWVLRNVEPNWTPLTAGDDFASMMEQRPGSFMLIGNGVAERGPTHMVHTPHYDFNDDIIPLGVEFWVSLVHQELSLGR